MTCRVQREVGNQKRIILIELGVCNGCVSELYSAKWGWFVSKPRPRVVVAEDRSSFSGGLARNTLVLFQPPFDCFPREMILRGYYTLRHIRWLSVLSSHSISIS